MMILLQVRGRLTAQALADEFEVSVRTIYRDIDALSMAGIPVYGDAGPNGGFRLLEGYSTRLTGVDADEAEALFLAGMPLLARQMGLAAPADRARGKLLAALPAQRRPQAERIASCFHFDMSEWYRAARPVPYLGDIVRAVLDKCTIRIDYRSWTARRASVVEPWGVVAKAGNWYLVAHREGRTTPYNIADIHALELGERCACPPPAFDLAAWWSEATEAFEARLRPGRARLRASPTGLQRLLLLGDFAGRAVAAAGPPDAAGWRALTLPMEAIDSMAPVLLGIGPELDIVAPGALRRAVNALALAVASRTEGPSNE